MLTLPYGLSFADLYTRDGTLALDREFQRALAGADAALGERYRAARAEPDALDRKAESDLLIAVAPHLEDFLAGLFGIADEVRALEARHHDLAPLFAVRRQFVQRRAMNAHKPDEAATFDGAALRASLEAIAGASFAGRAGESAFADAVTVWQKDPASHEAALDLATRYAAWAAHTAEGRDAHRGGVLFRAPRKLDMMRLVPIEAVHQGEVTAFKLDARHPLRRREGFALTDPGTDFTGGLAEAHYCIWCHEQGKDSCARGLPEKKPADGSAPANPYKKTVFGVPLAGCPLEEKISEFQKLRADGWPLGALAVMCVDNPMVAATGHRICNDCMKSCIYQKQDPVDIPQSETRILKDVLELPWGFEIYSLLTRWNPLNLRRPVPAAPSGRRVLVVGMGPAGFTLAHHLINDGHTVVGIDGLKIEPLPAALSGVRRDGARVPFEPVRDVATLREPLGERVMAGFGGVAEYGITVRWDKNFLKVIRLLLERRAQFAMYGGVRFGGTIDAEGAFALGFDHVALAAGAGKPTVLELPNGLANGVRTASDFLMALQLTGAAKPDSIANMQVRLPVVVIGGGLTAIDTATESLAYYPLQVEKFLSRYDTLAAERGEAAVRAAWTAEETAIADEFLAHARAIRAERAAAARDGRDARIAELVQSWGGVTVAYRRRLVDSPSYTLNHEEVEKALEEGIRFAEGLTPVAVHVDGHNRACALEVSVQHNDGDGVWHETGRASLPARTILVAAGTQPNTVLAREDADHFHVDGKYFRLLDEYGAPAASGPGPRQAGSAGRADRAPRGWARGQFLRRPASLVGRQRGEGDEQRQARLPDRLARARPHRTGVDGERCRVHRQARSRLPCHGRAGRAADADDRRGRGARARRRAPLPARAVLPAAELRVARRDGGWHAARDGGPGAHRCVGRPRAGTRVDDRARDGRLVRPLREPEAGRARRADGPDRRADRNRARRDRRAGRRRARQRRAVLDRPGVPRRRLEGAVLRRLQEDDRPLQGRGHRGRGRRRRLVLRRRSRLRARTSAGPDVRRQHRAGDARVRERRAGRSTRAVRRVPTASWRSAPTA